MIETEPICINMKQRINAIRKSCNHTTSSHSFQSLFLWAESWKLSVALDEDSFLIKEGNQNIWFFPCGKEETVVRSVRSLLKSSEMERLPLTLVYLREQDAKLLEECFPGVFKIQRDCSADEYLLDTEEYVSLSGRKYNRIRNGIHQVLPLQPEIVTVTKDNLHELEVLEDFWTAERDYIPVDDFSVLRLIQNWETLECSGILVKIGGQFVAAIAGYELSPERYDYVFSKTQRQIHGIADYTKHAFAELLEDKYRIINIEEDLGLEGLRTMKQLMRPSGMEKMYKAWSEVSV